MEKYFATGGGSMGIPSMNSGAGMSGGMGGGIPSM